MSTRTERQRSIRVDLGAWSVTVIVLVIVIAPVFRSPPRDSFPLSTYPMFSRLIGTETPVDIAHGLDADGVPVTLSPELIGGTDEVIVAGSVVRQAVRGGPEDVQRLCRAIAGRISRARSGDVADAGIVAVEIVTATHDAVAWFRGQREPLSEVRRGWCEVAR